MIKVLVVDDHDLVRAGIVRMLKDFPDIEVVGEAKSGEEALSFVHQTEVEVVLMDVRMPGIGGIAATRKLQVRFPNIKVIAVSVLDDDLYPTRLIKAGARGYVTKGDGLEEVVCAIHTVARGQPYISRSISAKLAMRAATGVSSPFETLSERELQITVMLIRGNRVADIAETLSLSAKTINTYRYRIFEKLDIKNDVGLTLMAVKYQLLGPEEVV